MRISDWSSDVCSSDLDEDRYRLSFGLGYASVRYDFYGAGEAAGDRGASIPLRQDGFFTNPWAEVRVADALYVGLQYRLIEARMHIDDSDRCGAIANPVGGRGADYVRSGFGPGPDSEHKGAPLLPRLRRTDGKRGR